MASLIALLKALPAPIEAGWILLMAWGISQIVWFRRAHVEAPDEAPAVRPPAPRGFPPQRRSMAFAEARPHESAGPPLDTIDIADFPDFAAPPSGASGSVLGLH